MSLRGCVSVSVVELVRGGCATNRATQSNSDDNLQPALPAKYDHSGLQQRNSGYL